MTWSSSKSAAVFCTLLIALLSCLLYQNSHSDDRLEFPLCYTHFVVPLRMILPKILPSILFTHGSTFREVTRIVKGIRSQCLGNEPQRELESVHREGKAEILRYARERGQTEDKKGALVYMHGGGFAFGSPEELSGPVAEFETQTGKEVFLMRYRLAPEHRFPAPVEDCISMVKWLFENYVELGIDKDDIQLFGDSAGGNLVTNVALELLQWYDDYPIRGVHAIYPWYYMMHDLPSAFQFFVDPAGVLNQGDIARFMSFYFLGDASCIRTKVLNKHLTENVKNQYSRKMKELGLEAFADYMKVLTDTWTATLHLSGDEDNNDHKMCASRYAQPVLDYRNNMLFTPFDKLNLLDRTRFNIYSCQVDLLRDESYLMDMLLNVTRVKHSHFSIENCYHGSFSDNTIGSSALRKKVIESMKNL